MVFLKYIGQINRRNAVKVSHQLVKNNDIAAPQRSFYDLRNVQYIGIGGKKRTKIYYSIRQSHKIYVSLQLAR